MTAPTSADEKRVLDAVPTQLLIGGSWRDGSGGDTIAVEDPATESELVRVADATADDAVAALDAAAAAQDDWARTAPRERGEILRRAFELMHERADDLALLMTLEMGKPLASSKGEVTYAAEFLRWFSEEAVRIDGRWSRNVGGAGRTLVMRQPVGPCLLVTPWNFPAAMGTRKIGPAIAAGCTMVVKPAQITPLSMLALGELFAEAGLPDGVLNIITSSSASRVSNPLLEDRRLRKLSFTGSTPVGQKLMQSASDGLLRLSMELGGNAPLIVFGDADVDQAVEQAVQAKMRNIGQSCVAANRMYVHEDVYDDFAAGLAEKIGAMKVGRGTEEGVEVGPLVNTEQKDKVAELVEDATSKGAKPVVGGGAPEGTGHFVEPTVLTEVPGSARCLKEEIFGPVAPLVRFRDEDDAVRMANDTEFGLVAYAFTSDLDRAIRVSERLATGMVGINTGVVSNPAAPFGGIKASGFGREGGEVGIDEYLDVKSVALATGE